MPKSVFKELWEDLQTKGFWSGFVKNIRKDEGYYWVYAEVSTVLKDGKVVEYKSIRTPVSFENKKKYQLLYDEIRQKDGDKKRKVIYE